jgi:hypothetical protein
MYYKIWAGVHLGTKHGNQYFDRLGGGVEHVENCNSNEYLKGMGISRCNIGKGLRLKMNCCKKFYIFKYKIFYIFKYNELYYSRILL